MSEFDQYMVKQGWSRLPGRVLIAAAGLFLIETGLVLIAPTPWLLGRVNADDFYYYLVLARSNAAGLGPSFDGQELTNGFHPLYLLLVTGLAELWPENPLVLIKASLIVLLLFHNLTGMVIATGFYARQRSNLSLLAGLIWLLNPWALAVTLHGVEAPIATFLWAIIIFWWLALHEKGDALPLGAAVGLGSLIGLAILARTDSLLWFGTLWLTVLYRVWRQPQIARQQLVGMTVLSLVALAVTLPWWWWNWTRFGMIVQVSSQAIRLWTHGFDWLSDPALIGRYVMVIGITYAGRVLIFAAIPLVLMGFGLWQRRYRPEWPGRVRLTTIGRQLDFAWLAVALLFCWYVGWQWNAQNWYLLSTVLVISIAAGLGWEQITAGLSRIELRPALGLLVFMSALFLVAGYGIFGFGYPRQERGYYLAQWLNENTEPQAVIGAWNSGIIAYFTDRQVINLDGVVNNSLYNHMVARRTTSPVALLEYIEGRGIDYITDYEYYWLDEFRAEVPLTLVYQSPVHQFRVYRLGPANEATWQPGDAKRTTP